MKRFTLLLFCAVFSFQSLSAQEKVTVDLVIDFQVTKYNKGVIYLSLYNSAESFMKKSFRGKGVRVKDNRVKFVFEDLPKGIYSFSYYHDVNSNKKLDKNFIGIPKEPYGFSNNEKGSFGPPSFEASNVNVDQNRTLNLNIK